MKKLLFLKKLFFALAAGAALFGCRPALDLQNPEHYFNMVDPDSTRLSTIFEGFWNGMNTNYAFWDVDPTDWDAVYDQYKPKFEALGTLRDLDDDDVTLINGYFEKMLENIVDGHFRLDYTFRGRSQSLRPILSRYKKQYGNAWPQSEILMEGSFLRSDNMQITGLNTAFIGAVKNSIDKDFCLFTRIIDGGVFNAATGYTTVSIDGDGSNKDILYFHFSGFSWGDIFNHFYSVFPAGSDDPRYIAIDDALNAYSGSAATVREVMDYSNYTIVNNGASVDYSGDLETLINYLTANAGISPPLTSDDWFMAIYVRAAIEHFDYFFDQLAARKNSANGHDVCGAIIDLRGNGGGLAQDLSSLWGRIVPADFVFAKNKFKSGENRLDYTPLMDFAIYKHPANDYGGVTDIPLVLVVNKFSVSCSEITTMLFKKLPNGHVVGGTTWGGLGGLHPNFNKFVNAGEFVVGKVDPNSPGILELVRTPGLQTLTLDGESFEGKGVPPDYPIPFKYSNMTGGIDDRLNEAIRIVREKQ